MQHVRELGYTNVILYIGRCYHVNIPSYNISITRFLRHDRHARTSMRDRKIEKKMNEDDIFQGGR